MHRINRLKLGEGWLCHLLHLTLNMVLSRFTVHSFFEVASSCISLGHQCYGRLLSLFRLASSALTRNLVVLAHRSLA
jgi:hypothetical protein